MKQQRRCLTGMTNGVPVNVSDVAPAVLIHTLDSSTGASDTNGRPFMDVVSLFLNNRDPAANANFIVTVGAVTMNFLLLPGQIVQVFDETAFGGPLSAPNGGLTITVLLSGNPLSTTGAVWGWFFRS